MLHPSETEERRAKNMIWNAAGDYSFSPDFMSFLADGTADPYLNCIIGAVRRRYDYRPLEDLFARMEKLPEAVFYQNLLWFGLAHSVYPSAVQDRPLLEEMRLKYAEGIVAHARAYWDQELLDRLQTAYCANLLGTSARLRSREKRLYQALLFDPALDASAIAEQMTGILKDFFRCRLPERVSGRPFLRLPIRFAMASFHGSPSFVSASRVQENEDQKADPLFTVWLPVLRAGGRRQRRLTWLEDNFGMSAYTSRGQEELEQLLCTGGHRSCHLHVTYGKYRGTSSLSSSSYRRAMELQKTRNLAFHHTRLTRHMLAVARMTDQIRNVLQFDTGGQPLQGRSGRLMAERVWRGIYLHDERIFTASDPCDKGNLSVDILLDASASQLERQERIAAQGYIIAESLTRCRLPVRVSSYCTVDGCTVLRIYRDYENPQDNEKIFEYCSAGWNRDGLAIRLAGQRLLSSDFENRLLIVLSDCSPNDDRRFFSRKGPVPFYYDYGGKQGVQDAAREVSRLRRQGVTVLAVCTGHEKDLPAAREIYCNDVVWAKTEDRFADAVSYLIREKIRWF